MPSFASVWLVSPHFSNVKFTNCICRTVSHTLNPKSVPYTAWYTWYTAWMIYWRHLGSQYKPFALTKSNHASQQDSVHIKETHGVPLPSSLEAPKSPQEQPSPVHSIN